MTRIELHCHTTASDGALAPAALVAQAHAAGVTTLAITDHDTVAGLPEARAAAAPLGITLLPGCEFGCELPDGEVHLLAYLFDETDAALTATLEALRTARRERGRAMVDRLHALGVPVSWDRVQSIAGRGSVGRPHVAQALIEGGWVADTDDAFARYIGWGGPAYVPRARISPPEVLALVAGAGGVVSLAHPAHIPNLEAYLPTLVPHGLAGLETYYGEYPPETVARLAALAARFDLVPTGGSDYHGRPIKDHAALGARTLPPDTVDRLWARARGPWSVTRGP
jgi:predicted metal-dependent phosphoesterase TrpH